MPDWGGGKKSRLAGCYVVAVEIHVQDVIVDALGIDKSLFIYSVQMDKDLICIVCL